MTKKLKPLLWLDGARGRYIPRDFAHSFLDRDKSVLNVNGAEWQMLNCPDKDYYWDVWQDVLEKAVVVTSKGHRYTLYQDQDLWLIPEGMVWSEDEDFYVWEDDNAAAV